MADIITYPENGITYDADDASGYLCTRESGVYSAEEDFAVSASDGLTVIVGAGHAWVRPTRWVGRSIIMEQPAELTLTEADAVRSRIDRIVLRYDAAAKKTSLQVLEGTPDSSGPVAPDISRTALVYDLGLATVRRTAGSTAVTAADITDTRADEAVCGVMRDGVTGIPTAQLTAQAKAMLDSLQEEVDSRSFYTKAEADAEHAKLQETLQTALQEQLGAQPVVVWSADIECSYKSGKLQLPDTVDYLEIKSNDAADSAIVWYLTPGNTISGIGYTVTGNSGTTFTLSDDRVLTYKSSSSTQRAYLVGYHYEKSAKFPCPVGYKSLTVNNNSGSFTADDAVDYALVQWTTDSGGDNPVTIRHSTILSRGRATGEFGFSQAGKISVPGSTGTYYFTLYRYVTLDELTTQLTETQAAQSDTDAMTVDQEYRLTLLELGITDTDTSNT